MSADYSGFADLMQNKGRLWLNHLIYLRKKDCVASTPDWKKLDAVQDVL